MAKKSREILKTYFKRGRMPEESHFNDLIDSMLNLIDDQHPDPDPDPPVPPAPDPPVPPVPPMPVVIVEVPANGKWYNLTDWENSCRAYSVMAGCGSKKADRYALIHAIAMHCMDNCFRIKKIRSWYLFFPSKLKLRWTTRGNCAALQIRTRRNYGEGAMIRCKLTELWGEQDMDAIFSKK